MFSFIGFFPYSTMAFPNDAFKNIDGNESTSVISISIVCCLLLDTYCFGDCEITRKSESMRKLHYAGTYVFCLAESAENAVFLFTENDFFNKLGLVVVGQIGNSRLGYSIMFWSAFANYVFT